MTLALALPGAIPPSPFQGMWNLLVTGLAPVPIAVVVASCYSLLVSWLVLEGVWIRRRPWRSVLRCIWAAFLVGLAFLVGRATTPPGVHLAVWYQLSVAAVAATFGLVTGQVVRIGIRWAARTPARRKASHLVLTLLCALSFAGLWWVTLGLPAERSSYFVLWHQAVRIGAAATGTLTVLLIMLALLPVALDRLEGTSFIQFVAARHVRAGKSKFLTAISLLSIAGVGVSSFALCAVIAVMTGFGEDLKHKILGNNAHVKVEAKDVGGFDHWRDTLAVVRATPGVVAATPVAAGEAMASSRTNTAGVMLRGVDLESITAVIELERNIEVGSLSWLSDPQHLANLPADTVIWLAPGGQRYLKGEPSIRLPRGVDPDVYRATYQPDEYPGIVLGRELAKTLHVYVGEELTLVAPLGDLGPMGVMPRNRRFRVAAVFYSGMYEYDAAYAYVTLEAGQEFLDLAHRITDIDAKVASTENVGPVRTLVEQRVGRSDLRVRDWQEMNRQLFSALKLEKIATFIILGIAIIVASFCIICTLLLMVTEKTKEIAILKALGASDRAVLRIFMLEGIIIGAIGTVFGVALGLASTLGVKHFGVRLDPDVYYVDRLPINVDPRDFLLVAIASMLITTLATVYPALAASRLRPVEGIRYE